jgi:hypothetical protein
MIWRGNNEVDTVDLVLTLLGTLVLTNIVSAVLALRNWYRAEVAQREIARLSDRQRAAGYDTGLVEIRRIA